MFGGLTLLAKASRCRTISRELPALLRHERLNVPASLHPPATNTHGDRKLGCPVYRNSAAATSKTGHGPFATVNREMSLRACARSGLAEFRGWPRIGPGDDHVFERGRQMLASFDPRLDQHVDGAAGHDQVLHIVAADENKLAAPIDRRRFHHAKPTVTPPQETPATPPSGHDEGPERPGRERDERDHEQEGCDGEDDAAGVGHGRHFLALLGPQSRSRRRRGKICGAGP